jgi:class 3 adenylate cyclase
VDIGAWLHGLGLEQYESAFRANEVDERVLPSLTADDLKDLGVILVGHRRRLLDAIAALGARVRAAAVTVASPDPPVQADAERRQLTVMFCDLVGSTELSARLDPEDLREVIAAYRRAVADVVRSFDRFVAKYMGDGVLAYFGYPSAHEDDASPAATWRAVSSAPAIRPRRPLASSPASWLSGRSSWLTRRCMASVSAWPAIAIAIAWTASIITASE